MARIAADRRMRRMTRGRGTLTDRAAADLLDAYRELVHHEVAAAATVLTLSLT